MTAEDVAFSYTMALNKDTKSNRLSRLSIIKGGADYSNGKAEKVAGIVVLDPQTIRFDMEFPNALFLVETDLAVLPKHILGNVAPADLEKHPFMFDAPIGSGPFKAVKNLTDQSSEIAANPDFYRGKPKLDKIVFRIVKQADAAQIALERGEVDFNAAPSGSINLAPDALSRYLAQPSLFMVRMPNPVSANARVQSAHRLLAGQTRAPGDGVCDRPQEDYRQPVGWHRRDCQLAHAAPVGAVQGEK